MSSIISKLINVSGNVTGILPVVNGGTGVATSTGTTNVVLSNGPTLVAPVLGTPASGNLSNCTAYPNVTQSVAGLVVSAGQLLGTNTNDNASAGNVGEFIQSQITSYTAVPSTTVFAQVTSISVTAGDWDIWGQMAYQVSGTTVMTRADAVITQTAAGSYTPNDTDIATGIAGREQPAATSGATDLRVSLIPTRQAFSGTTTVRLLCAFTYSAAGGATYAGSIYARRVR